MIRNKFNRKNDDFRNYGLRFHKKEIEYEEKVLIFQVTGIAVLLAFYGCYFIKMTSQSRKGIKTDQLGKGKSGSVKNIELAVKISAYMVLASEVFSIILDIHFFVGPVRVLGGVFGIAGVVVFVISVLTMQDSWRAGVSKMDQTELVTKGIYRFSRNPAFLGFDFVYIGILLMFFHWILLAVSVFAGVMLHLQIVYVEEGFLKEVFGEKYLEYQKKVCRYLGRK